MKKSVKKCMKVTAIAPAIAGVGLSTTTLSSCSKSEVVDYTKTTVPFLKQYDVTSKSSFIFQLAYSIYIESNQYEDLADLASQRFHDAGLTYQLAKVQINNNPSLSNGDFYLQIRDSIINNQGEEAYQIEISDKITIKANGERAAYYAINSLIQIYINNNGFIYYGTILDYPDLNERTVHLDCGRKYFTPEWIKNFILQISYEKVNTLQLHFSELSCFRLELPLQGNPLYLEVYDKFLPTDEHKGLAGARNGFDERYLTALEMQDIVEFAHEHYVEVIPSLDTPGHSRYLIEWYDGVLYGNEYFEDHTNNEVKNLLTKWDNGMDNKTEGIHLYNNIEKTYKPDNYDYYYDDSYITFPGAIDITKAHAQELLNDLYRAYGKFFKDLGCTKFDIGFDEFVEYDRVDSEADDGYYNTFRWYANDHDEIYGDVAPDQEDRKGADVLVWWMNHTAKLLQSMGYRVRAYNDQINNKELNCSNIETDPNIDILYWTNDTVSNYATANELAEAGYNLINLNYDHLYYVLGANMPKPQGNDVYNNWDVYTFSQNVDKLQPQYYDKLISAYYCIWCDYYSRETEETIWEGSFKSIATFASKTWNIATNNIPYDTLITNIKNIGKDPQNSLNKPFNEDGDYIIGPSHIDTTECWDYWYEWDNDGTDVWEITKTIEYANNANFWLDDIPYANDGVHWEIADCSPYLKQYLNSTISGQQLTLGTARGSTYYDTVLLVYPNFEYPASGEYAVVLKASVLLKDGSIKEYTKEITLTY